MPRLKGWKKVLASRAKTRAKHGEEVEQKCAMMPKVKRQSLATKVRKMRASRLSKLHQETNRTVQGRLHQGSNIFERHAGRQCRCNCAVFLVGAMTTPVKYLNTRSLDSILQDGAALYDKLPKLTGQEYLMVSHLGELIHYKSSYYKMTIVKDFSGLCYSNQIFLKAVDDAINSSCSVFIVLKDSASASYTSAIYRDSDSSVYSYDPHARDSAGLPSATGTAVVIRHMTTDTLHDYLTKLAGELNAKHFEVVAVSFQTMSVNVYRQHCLKIAQRKRKSKGASGKGDKEEEPVAKKKKSGKEEKNEEPAAKKTKYPTQNVQPSQAVVVSPREMDQPAGQPQGQQTHIRVVQPMHGRVVQPQTRVVQPQTRVVQQHARVVQQHARVVQPQTRVVQPQTRVVKPQTRVVQPQTRVVQPQTRVVQPQTRVVQQHARVVQQHARVIQPHTRVVQPRLTQSNLQNLMHAAQGAAQRLVGSQLARPKPGPTQLLDKNLEWHNLKQKDDGQKDDGKRTLKNDLKELKRRFDSKTEAAIEEALQMARQTPAEPQETVPREVVPVEMVPRPILSVETVSRQMQILPVEVKEKPALPLETRRAQFRDLLAEKGVSALSTISSWEKEVHAVVCDQRYLQLTSRDRKEVFERYVKERAEEELRQQREQKNAFKELLEEAKERGKSLPRREKEAIFSDFAAKFRSREKSHQNDRTMQIPIPPVKSEVIDLTDEPPPSHRAEQQPLTKHQQQQRADLIASSSHDNLPEQVRVSSTSVSEKEVPLDFSSIKGVFGWTTIDDVNIPYILRQEKQFVSVRMVYRKLLRCYQTSSLDDLSVHPTSFFITVNEAKLLNEINIKHCAGEYGREEFSATDLIMPLTDFNLFYTFVKEEKKKVS